MNEKNAAPEPGERSCLSRTGVILEIEEREYRRRFSGTGIFLCPN